MDLSQLHIFSSEGLVALVTLTLLEVVLGIDNLVLVALQVGRLKPESRKSGRVAGLLLGAGLRIVMVFGVSILVKLDRVLFTIFAHDITIKGLLLILGGLYLIYHSTHEIIAKVHGIEERDATASSHSSFGGVMVALIWLSFIFSIDSVFMAVGMTSDFIVMTTSIVISILIMLLASGPITAFVEKHRDVQMLAVSFLMLIGVLLIADGFGQHISKGYVYFAMAFSCGVDLLQHHARKKVS
jgi:predicted tellurium resistance membrane protein TerC